MKLLGTIEICGPYIALRTSPTCHYPLGGNSGIASDFRETFNDAAPHDISKRLYRHNAGHLCMESNGQVAARKAADMLINPPSSGPLRDYAAARELERIAPLSAFNVNGYTKRRRLNQHATRYEFADRSAMVLYLSRRRADAWHYDWKGKADDIHLGPIKGVPIRVNKNGV